MKRQMIYLKIWVWRKNHLHKYYLLMCVVNKLLRVEIFLIFIFYLLYIYILLLFINLFVCYLITVNK